MTSRIKLGDEFLKVPKGLTGYLYGTTPSPTNPAEGQSLAWISTTANEIQAVEKDAIMWQQIAITISNSLFVQLVSKSTAKEYFKMLKSKFEGCSLVVSIELRCQLGEMKLKEGGDA
ncbi:hypothetical protein V8B97DRAFT_2023314 [Scleroderma yunnanense]